MSLVIASNTVGPVYNQFVPTDDFGYYEQLCTPYDEFSYEQYSVTRLQRVCL